MKANYLAVDNWSVLQCRNCMIRLGGMEVHLSEIKANLDFYRECCMYIISDVLDKRERERTRPSSL